MNDINVLFILENMHGLDNYVKIINSYTLNTFNIFVLNSNKNVKLKTHIVNEIVTLDDSKVFEQIDCIVNDNRKLATSIENIINNLNNNKKLLLFSKIYLNITNNYCVQLQTMKIHKMMKEITNFFNNSTNKEEPIKQSKPIDQHETICLKPEHILTTAAPNKITFRNTCLSFLQTIKNINIPDICDKSDKECVFIEYRQLLHLEVLIRNCIIKLGSEWSYTFVCGEESFNYYKDICSRIHKNIKVINTGHTFMNQNTYNNMLLSVEFWELLVGEKILICQEDSFIFKDNINDFLKWDYIGAPFRMQCVEGCNVGNGGLSLRSKSKMIEVIKHVPLSEVNIKGLKPFVQSYISHQKLDNIPEDIYFSNYLQNVSLGVVADVESAKQFSSDTIFCEDAFGMHCMWNGCRKWHNFITDSLRRVTNNAETVVKNDDELCSYDNKYLDKIDEFCEIMNKNRDVILSNPKEEFRYFCYRYLDYIRCINLPNITQNNYYEAVLIEYRCLPNLEFLIRNCIYKLGSEWSQTIVCGNLNYEYMLDVVKKINRDIKVIKTNYNNLTPSDYSFFLASDTFWNLLIGEKILIYQEDTCIFKKNIMDFIHWDYIGAPYLKEQNDTPNGVGNGGFSLRSKSIMLEIINKIGIIETNYNSSTTNYMYHCRLTVPPEDVYFSKNMQELNIGKVADWDTAYDFSSECVFNENSFGCHGVWVYGKLIDCNYNRNLVKKKLYNLLKTYTKINLLIFSYGFMTGGGETFPIHLANILDSMHVNVIFMYFNNNINYNIYNLLNKNIKTIKYDSNFDEIVNKYSITHVSSHHHACDCVVFNHTINHKNNFKHYVTDHGMYKIINDHIYHLVDKCKPNFVYLNDTNFSNIKDINCKSYKIPISIYNYKCENIIRGDYNIKDDDFVITLASRCVKYKGWEEAIIIFNELNKKYKHLKLLLIGDLNDYGIKLKSMCTNDNITFLGYQTNIKRFFEISNVGILPSYFYGESNPIVLIECLFANKPFISSDVGDISNMLKGDGELAGSVIKLCDGKINIDSYIQEIEKYIIDNNFYENKIKQAKIASLKFNISNIGCKYLDMFLN